MVKPLFYTRMRLGEFDPPEMNPYTKLGFNDVLTPDHKALALEAAMKSFVLLKNDGILPLKNIGTAGVVGPMANNAYQQFGTYSPHPPQSDVTTPLDALKAVASSVHYAAGCDDNNCKTYNSSEVLKAISGTNIIFVVLGTGAAVEKESHDRAGTELPGHQKTLLLDVLEHIHSHTPVVLLLFTAGPVNISFADRDPDVRAIMQCFLPAQATGQAVRHVLLNDVKGAVPAGRLPYTWPLLASQLPPMVNYSMQGRTYRYFEGEPLYPFGYGLSYTTFEYTASVHTTTVTAGQPLTGSFWVKNTGKYEADEVSQVYIAWRNNTVPAPKLQLVWFKRYSLPTGGADIKVDFEVEARSMALWFDDGWHVTEGSMDIFIGGQQPNQARRSGSEVILGQFQITGSAYLGKY
ncbi:hypothetical protein V1264_016258 [Littorina saxatilis]|uniref:Fibronectin type III-like domain-containing protein n=2 Tax=Littorina saxatilis TaxID=31220 RepID=A0AAN9BNN0_9CAEN